MISALPARAYQPNGANGAPLENQAWKVRFEGNATFRDIVLKQIIATEPPTVWKKVAFWNRGGNELDLLEIRRDVIRIERYYQRRGFANVRVSYRTEAGNRDWKQTVIFVIDENAPIRITDFGYIIRAGEEDETLIRGSTSFRRAQRRHEFQPGNRYQTISEPDVIGRFSDLLKNLGYAFADVKITADIDSTRNRASVTLILAPGPVTYLDEINVQGNKTVSGEYVSREAALTRGKRYALSDIQEGQKELFNHHLFRFATINIPEQPHDSTLSLDINVRENAIHSVQVLLGLGTEDLLRGQVSWVHRNAFERGHRLTVSSRASFIEQSLNLDYLFPYIFNTKSSVVISPFVQHILERDIFELFHGGLTNSFIYRYRDDLTGTMSYQFTRNLELTQQSEEALPDTTFEYDLSSFQFSGYYSPGFSRRGLQGWVVQPYAEFSGLFGAAAFAFQKFSVDIRRFTKLSPSTTLAARVQAGAIYNVAQDSLPQNIRYYLGGTSSVRGWNRNQLGPKRARFDTTGAFLNYVPVGGRALFGFNTEIRQELNFFIRGLGIAVFLDGGQVWRDPREVDVRPVQFGVGGGLRYRSPIGPIRVDVGYKLNPTDEDLNIFQGEDRGGRWDRIGIHFSIGQAF